MSDTLDLDELERLARRHSWLTPTDTLALIARVREAEARAGRAERVVEAAQSYIAALQALGVPRNGDYCADCDLKFGHEPDCLVTAASIASVVYNAALDAPEPAPPYGGSTLTFLQEVAGMAHEDDGGDA